MYERYATVIVDKQAIKPLDYGVPAHLLEKVNEGSRVLIPLRKQTLKGTVLYIRKKSALKKVQPLLDVIMDKIPEDLFELANWMSQYYATPLRKVLSCMIPSPVRDDKQAKHQTWIKRAKSKPILIKHCAEIRAKHPSQAKVIEALLKHDKGLFLSDLLHETGVSQSPIDTLIKNKFLTKELHTVDRSLLLSHEYFQTQPKKLNDQQQQIYDSISDFSSFRTHLLHGITGSGKTEIYLQLIQKALDNNKGVIFLIPEIALTAQTIERIKSRFQTDISIIHSRLSDGERLDAWKKIRDGKSQIVVGARSAIFSPLPNLGLIIVDEEQDGSFKQTDEMPCYNGRDVAIMRAKQCNAVVLLGSATPSLESYYNALQNKYTLHTLTQRAASAHLPKVSIIDMRLDRESASRHPFFSETLLSKMRARAARGEQTILFLNRRGTYSTLKCQKCEHVIQCPHCDVSLTFHRSNNHLSCHLCGYTASPPPSSCPECKSTETIKFKGPGTDQVERSLNAMFPDIRTMRMDGDTTRKKGAHDQLFKQFRAGKADVLIGTQMIAKGLHFPAVTLVAVLNSDGALNIPDFRSHENVFQLTTQVAGRSGRSDLEGEVLLQTRMPDHPIFQYVTHEDFPGFYKNEVQTRKLFDYPPYGHLIKLTFSGPDDAITFDFGKTFRQTMLTQLPPHYTLTPIVPCTLARIKDRFRFQFFIKGKSIPTASKALQELNTKTKRPKEVGLVIDINPRDSL